MPKAAQTAETENLQQMQADNGTETMKEQNATHVQRAGTAPEAIRDNVPPGNTKTQPDKTDAKSVGQEQQAISEQVNAVHAGLQTVQATLQDAHVQAATADLFYQAVFVTVALKITF